MKKTVVLLLSVLLSGISFSTAAATTAACDALLASPVSEELIARVAEAVTGEVDVRELISARLTLLNEQAKFVMQARLAREEYQKLKESQPRKPRTLRIRLEEKLRGKELGLDDFPTPEVRAAKQRHEALLKQQALANDQIDAAMSEHVDSVVLKAAAKVDPYFAMLVANYGNADYVVNAADQVIEMLADLTAVQPRATLNPWPHLRGKLGEKRTVELKAQVEDSWRMIFDVAREAKFETSAPEIPGPLTTFSDYERLASALTELRTEATPTRDLLKSRVDEIVRGVVGAILQAGLPKFGPPAPAPQPAPVRRPRLKRRLRWKIKLPIEAAAPADA